jgi:ABC-type multidrug transport system fused ATPase/permease subunit
VSSQIDVGAIVRRTFEIYVDQASVLMPAAAVVFVISGIFGVLLIAASPALALVALIVSIVASTLFTGMVVELVADLQDGRRDASPGQLLRAASPVIGKLILVGIVAGIGIVIGFVLIVVPGLILITIWSVAAPVVVLERPDGLGALGRSRELVRGNGWNVFAVILLLVILVGVVSFLIEAVANSAGTGVGLVVRVIVGILTAPISSLAQAVLYFQLRGAPVREGADGPGERGQFQAGPLPPATP